MSAKLFDPIRVGAIALRNRIVMAPMTRMRANRDGVPTSLMAEYYAQRATAGLIVTEGTAISQQAQGFPRAPGIYSVEQTNGWRSLVHAVHEAGGRIVIQLAHNGRNSHSSLAGNALPVAPSAVVSNIPALTADFKEVQPQVPRPLTAIETEHIVDDFGLAAERAMDLGFDGVELQAANSHLIDQFMEDGTNLRCDRYGGSIENRSTFLSEIVERVSAVIGKERVGVRLSPFGQYGGIHDSHPLQLFTSVVRVLSGAQIAYVHLIEARAAEIGLREGIKQNGLNNAQLFREHFRGALISAGGYTPESAGAVVSDGFADAVAFGRLYTSNPDLVERIQRGYRLTAYDRTTFYGGAAEGYTDFAKSH
jgi:N-ethylmaleimide reductase